MKPAGLADLVLRHTDGVTTLHVAESWTGQGKRALTAPDNGVAFLNYDGTPISLNDVTVCPNLADHCMPDFEGLDGVGAHGFFVNGPRHLNFMLGDECNANCLMCWQAARRAKERTRRGQLPPAVFAAVVGQHWSGLYSVELCSFGEPMLHPDFGRFVRLLTDIQSHRPATTQQPLLLNLVTNGSMLLRHHLELARMPGCVTVSIDGSTRERYGRLRRGLDFRTVVAGLRAVCTQPRLPLVNVNMVVLEDNILDIPAMAALTEETGADSLTLLRGDGLERTGATGLEILDDDYVAGVATVAAALHPRIAVKDWTKRAADTAVCRTGGTSPYCTLPWKGYDVGPDGRAHPCCRAYGQDLGDATAAWSSPRFERLRRQLRNRNVDAAEFPDCARCPHA